MAEYKVFLSLSHRNVSYEYYVKGGDDALQPIPVGKWPAPLAFMVKDVGVSIGYEAEQAALRGVYNTYRDYFALLRQSVVYKHNGERKNIGKILLDASEPLFREFFKKSLMGRVGDLDDNRQDMPLYIICESDITSDERAYLQDLFHDSGYGAMRMVKYEHYIERYIRQTLAKEYTCKKVLVLWTEGKDLCLTLFDAHGTAKSVSKILPELGVDPRLKLVKKRIWEGVRAQNIWLEYDKEELAIEKAAADFLNSSKLFVRENIVLSDGYSYQYSLVRTDIDLYESDASVALKRGVENFLVDNALNDRSEITVLLRGVAAGNPYFESNIGMGYARIIRTDKELREQVMKLILKDKLPISQIVSHDGNPASTHLIDWRKKYEYEFKHIKESVDNLIYSRKYEDARNEIDVFRKKLHDSKYYELDERLKQLEDSIPTAPPVLEPVVKEPTGREKRRMREVLATANTNISKGNYDSAISVLEDFKTEMNIRCVNAFDEKINQFIAQCRSERNKIQLHPTKTDSRISKDKQTKTKPIKQKDKLEQAKVGSRVEKEAKQKVKIAEATSHAELRNGNIKKARTILEQAKADLNSKGIHDFDNMLDARIQQLSTNCKEEPTKAKAGQPSKRDERDMIILQKSVETKMLLNNAAAARQEINEFKERMHAKGVSAFDVKLNELSNSLSLRSKPIRKK